MISSRLFLVVSPCKLALDCLAARSLYHAGRFGGLMNRSSKCNSFASPISTAFKQQPHNVRFGGGTTQTSPRLARPSPYTRSRVRSGQIAVFLALSLHRFVALCISTAGKLALMETLQLWILNSSIHEGNWHQYAARKLRDE